MFAFTLGARGSFFACLCFPASEGESDDFKSKVATTSSQNKRTLEREIDSGTQGSLRSELFMNPTRNLQRNQ